MFGNETLMLVLVAVRAQQLPVAAVRRVVVVIVITVMNFEQLQIGMSEVAAATSANPRIDLERLLAISLGALFTRAPRFSNDTIEPDVVGSRFAIGHVSSPAHHLP